MKKSKKIVSAMLVLAGILTSLTGCDKTIGNRGSGDGYRKNTDMSGECGENLTYEYIAKTGKLTIHGTGEMTSCPWSGYGGVTVKSVEFEEGITSLYHGAFYAQNELEGDIILPSTLTYIDDFAFYGTKSLSSVKLAEGTTYLGDYAFRQSGISGELYLPDSITYIGEECFNDCENLTGTLRLPSSLKTIKRVAFDGCVGFTGDLVIPDSVEEIGDYAFAQCTGFDGTLAISSGLTEIPDNCFYLDKGFEGDLIIPDSVKRIGKQAFSQCGFDGTLSLPAQMEEIADGAFEYCENITGKIVLPEGVTRINAEVFNNCRNITSVDFSTSIKYICQNAFSRCELLTGELKLPEGLVGIGTSSFSGCKSLSGKLVFPETLEIIENGAFSGCSGISGELILPKNILKIGEATFSKCEGLTGELIIPDTVTNIGEDAFENCSGISRVVLGNGVVSIGGNAFSGCSSCKEAEFINEDVIPDYYTDEKEASFDAGCALIIPSKARPVNEIWNKKQSTFVTQSDNKNKKTSHSNSEVPYYWTDSLKGEDFYGYGADADAKLVFEDSVLSISINEREAAKYSYYADSNSSDGTILTDKIGYKDGYIEGLAFMYGYNIRVIKGTYVLEGGAGQDIYFITSPFRADLDIDLLISLEEDRLEFLE